MLIETNIVIASTICLGLGLWIRNLQKSNEKLKSDMSNQLDNINAQMSEVKESLFESDKKVEMLMTEKYRLEKEKDGLRIRIEEYNKRNDEIISVRLESERERYKSQILEKVNERENELMRQHKIEIENAKESSRRQALTSNFGRDMQDFLPFIIASKEGIHHKEVQWVGGTIDAIAFEGLIGENGQEADGEVTIRFIEMKTSNDMKRFIDNPNKSYMKTYDPFHAKLSDKQKRISAAVEAGRIRFEIWAMDSETKETGVFKKDCIALNAYAAK